MRKIRLTVAQALIKFLDKQYVIINNKEEKFIEGIIAIFGHGNVLGLGEALSHENHDLKFHQEYNEQSMGHIAMGYAKQNKNKKIYAVTSSVGPGAANMITSAGTATANRIPVLYLPGDVYGNRQPDPVLQQIEHSYNLGISTNDAFKSVSVYWDRVDRPEKLMSAMINAMLALTNLSCQGAVTIGLSQDVQGEVFDYPKDFFKKRIYSLEGPEVSANDIDYIIDSIKSSHQPLIICGGGVKYSDSEKELDQFVKKYKIPIAETQAGKSALVSDNEWNLGGIGTTGFLSANSYAKKADLIIGLGTRYTDFTTASKSLFSNNSRFININASRFDARKMDGKIVVADIKKVLKTLISKMILVEKPRITKLVRTLKEKANEEIVRLHNIEVEDINKFIPEVNDIDASRQIKSFYAKTNSKFTQTQALGIINETINKDAIIVAASGSLPGDMQRIWKSKSVNSYHVEYGYSCMGYEIAAALGAKFAFSNKDVYAIVGDGAYMMLHTSLLTSMQEKQKINVLLFNNSSFGCINNLQVGKGINSLGTEFRTRNSKKSILDGDIMSVNYSIQAKGYGVKTYRIKTKEELIEAIKDSKKQAISTLIEILILPKTMTNNYESWWRVGNAGISKNKNVIAKTNEDNKMIKNLKGY